MAIVRSVITALDNRGVDLLGTKNVALKLADDQNIVSGSLLTVESNHFRTSSMDSSRAIARLTPEEVRLN